MIYRSINWPDIHCKAAISQYVSATGSGEFQAIIELTEIRQSAEEQFENIKTAILRLFTLEEFNQISLVWKKYFVSDAVNQQQFLKKTVNEAVSFVQQPPLNGTKVSVWLYGMKDASVYTLTDGETLVERPFYSHLFHTQLHEKQGNSYDQTYSVFSSYEQSLKNLKVCVKDNCIRTWIYVQNVDNQYAGMVKARRKLFSDWKMTPQTHFIASTGIEGRYIYPEVSVLVDAYAIPEIKAEQISFLHGASNLNPTHEYGVTFERGTVIQYGDRRHVFISGTASIDNKGEIVYPLDIRKQTERTLENIQVLLNEAGSEFSDVAHFIVYLRDTSDYQFVDDYLKAHYPEIPYTVVLAPVCRPGWLIEIECMAVISQKNEYFPDF